MKKHQDPRYVPGISEVDDDMSDEEWLFHYGDPAQTQEDTMYTATLVTNYLPQYVLASDATLYKLSASLSETGYVVILSHDEYRFVWVSDSKGDIQGDVPIFGTIAENDSDVFSELDYKVID